ncbi:hypothetical protein [Haliea salexigens]|uniref:hypothetical protein n=1 Tax=Haliea salexigens TaxID=287487 RepID=UPI0003FF9392|nr:hypothetical protein [Haliea salexigens]
MNAKFKPLGLVAAVAAATAGYNGVANAQLELAASSDLGNLALIPYYTVRDGNVTGVHLTNTSDSTQVVKVRLRRGTDSMDALDFNLILSPKDVWTGFLAAEGENVVFNTTDSSCTAPATVNGKFTMPGIYRADADEGYIEIIGMGQPLTETAPIAVSAKHGAEGVPASCTFVRDNFFANGSPGTTRGVVDGATSVQRVPVGTEGATTLALNEYEAPDNALKVSYFVRDAGSGREFGNSATHIANFLVEPSITNQQFGLFSGDLLGFDYPDLNGGTGAGIDRDRFKELRAVLGGASVINDWSANADLNVGTDWVITFPGQYTMLDLPHYFASLLTAGEADPDDRIPCNAGLPLPDGVFAGLTGACDHRDIPAVATFDVYDREEQQRSQPDGELVVSPALPGQVVQTLLPFEVNVVQWGAEPVLGSENSDIVVAVPDSPFGWAELNVTSSNSKVQAVCEASAESANFNIGEGFDAIVGAVTAYGCNSTDVNADEIPKIGFVAWERSFPANPDSNYGRIVEHSYGGVGS